MELFIPQLALQGHWWWAAPSTSSSRVSLSTYPAAAAVLVIHSFISSPETATTNYLAGSLVNDLLLLIRNCTYNNTRLPTIRLNSLSWWSCRLHCSTVPIGLRWGIQSNLFHSLTLIPKASTTTTEEEAHKTTATFDYRMNLVAAAAHFVVPLLVMLLHTGTVNSSLPVQCARLYTGKQQVRGTGKYILFHQLTVSRLPPDEDDHNYYHQHCI